VTYANEEKTRLLGVPPSLLETHGAVSEAVARAMAEGARARFGTSHALAITGVAGPGGGTAAKPVGTVWSAIAGPGPTVATLHAFGARDRSTIRRLSVSTLLDAFRRTLLERS
jgi:PncC family amidohydrolase